MVYDNWVFPKYKVTVVKELARLIPRNGRVLDVGCNDGYLAMLLMQTRPDLKIEGVDIQNHKKSLIPRKIYDGKNLPYKDNSFDTVMAIDVLHHIPGEIKSLLAEMKRVSKSNMLIKDHMANNWRGNFWLSITDWFANVQFGIRCTFNFLSEKEWQKLFRELNLMVSDRIDNIHFGYKGDKKYHWVVMLKKEHGDYRDRSRVM